MEQLKFRCSRLGDLMTNGRAKDEPLGETAKAYILEELIRQELGYTKIEAYSNKYFEKGNANEDVSIAMYSNYKGRLFIKNEQRYSNEIIVGTPDIVDLDNKTIVDVKTAWDIFTFEKATLTKNYYWQLVGYMLLTGCDQAELAYCLTDTPKSITDDEKRKWYWKLGGDNMEGAALAEYKNVCEAIDRNASYKDINWRKIRTWSFELTTKDVELLTKQTEYANEYAEEYLSRSSRNN